jgi:hypothetical protein
MLQSTTLRPGLLVSVKTALDGGVLYEKRDLESEQTDEGAQKARWETERTIFDPVEHKRAGEIRSKARWIIASVCAHSAFGMLCPENRSVQLELAIVEARRIIREFNTKARLTRVSLYVITGRIAADDVEALKAINSEVRDLLESMKTGVENLDVRKIRDAADRARDLGRMLSNESQARVAQAIDAARAAARKIVKAGEQAAVEVDRRAVQSLLEARTAFLDLDEAKQPAAPDMTGRALDLEPAPPTQPTVPEQLAPELE